MNCTDEETNKLIHLIYEPGQGLLRASEKRYRLWFYTGGLLLL
jgi:hypothetical protein